LQQGERNKPQRGSPVALRPVRLCACMRPYCDAYASSLDRLQQAERSAIHMHADWCCCYVLMRSGI
jgi:hypothetical protein